MTTLKQHYLNCQAISNEYTGEVNSTLHREHLIGQYIERNCPKGTDPKWFLWQVKQAKHS